MSQTIITNSPVTVTAPSGVMWTRRPESDSTPEQFLAALRFPRDAHGGGRVECIEQIVFGWENGPPPATDDEAEAYAADYIKAVTADIARGGRARRRRAASEFDAEREKARLHVLRLTSDV
ncbi:MAG: hypothetical protein JWP14_1053 [Frankiales bacterium]|jgi:hypothetical protein|nr:hypothetical protein [Frankiales bacterium]